MPIPLKLNATRKTGTAPVNAFVNHKQIEAGRDNRERIRMWQTAHPWGTQSECAKALNLSPMAVGRHVKAIRAEWRDQ